MPECVPIAPVDMLVDALNSHLNLQRYKILFISGNYSRLLSRLDRNFTDLDIRRAFTSFQLMTILEENHHSFLIVEHDPMLYEDAKQMVEYVGQALKQTSREATILLYAPSLDPHLQTITDLADRVFCFYESQARGRTKANMRTQALFSSQLRRGGRGGRSFPLTCEGESGVRPHEKKEVT